MNTGSTRLFPTYFVGTTKFYDKSMPYRHRVIDGECLNDDGTSVGGYTDVNLVTCLRNEECDGNLLQNMCSTLKTIVAGVSYGGSGPWTIYEPISFSWTRTEGSGSVTVSGLSVTLNDLVEKMNTKTQFKRDTTQNNDKQHIVTGKQIGRAHV